MAMCGMFVPAADADVPAIVKLLNRAYRGATGWSTEAAYIDGDRTTEALLRAEMAATPEGLMLAWREGVDAPLAGCVWLEPVGPGVWYLGSLAVDPPRQAGGFGKMLLGAAENWVRERGGVRVRIQVVNVREALIAWYVRRGYRLTGETSPFPYGDDRFGVPMRNDLSFVVLEKAVQVQ